MLTLSFTSVIQTTRLIVVHCTIIKLVPLTIEGMAYCHKRRNPVSTLSYLVELDEHYSVAVCDTQYIQISWDRVIVQLIPQEFEILCETLEQDQFIELTLPEDEEELTPELARLLEEDDEELEGFEEFEEDEEEGEDLIVLWLGELALRFEISEFIMFKEMISQAMQVLKEGDFALESSSWGPKLPAPASNMLFSLN